jgi:hypothetical protein
MQIAASVRNRQLISILEAAPSLAHKEAPSTRASAVAADALSKLAALKEAGVLTMEEFDAARERLQGQAKGEA